MESHSKIESDSNMMRVVHYGYCFEDLNVGDKFRHGSRTINETDKAMFLYLSGLNSPLFVDQEYAKNSPLKQSVVPGPLSVILIIGLAEDITRGRDLAALGIDKIRFVKPVRPGDQVSVKVSKQRYPITQLIF